MNHWWRRPTEQYRGLDIRCAPGVHAAALAALRPHLQEDARICDLASGTGAFAARLIDHGHRHLRCVDRDVAHFGLREVPCSPVDLDGRFADRLDGPYDAVTAIEIIEHLSSPLAFLREVRALLRDGGIALISTPNVGEWTSRIKFLLRGELRYFDESQYRYQRHLSPLLPNLVPFFFDEAGLSVLSLHTAGSFDGPLRHATVGSIGRGAAALRRQPSMTGDCLLIVARAIAQRQAEAA